MVVSKYVSKITIVFFISISLTWVDDVVDEVPDSADRGK